MATYFLYINTSLPKCQMIFMPKLQKKRQIPISFVNQLYISGKNEERVQAECGEDGSTQSRLRVNTELLLQLQRSCKSNKKPPFGDCLLWCE